jgi:hypothetical protein
MRSIVHAVYGEPAEVLALGESPLPEPGPGQARVRMQLSPIHNHDLWTVRGQYGYKPTLPAIAGSEAFGTVELCCRNAYNSPAACRASQYSQFFKNECPQAFTYAHDSPSLTHECSAPRELKVIFCH